MRMRHWIGALLAIAMCMAAGGQRARAQDRFAVGAQVAVDNLPELGETPVGYGFRFTYGVYPPFLALDSEFDNFPTSSTGNLGESQFFLGLKAGFRAGRWGFFLKARPGFDHFGGGFDPQRLTQATHFALDLGGGVEYYFAPHLGLRWDLSDVLTYFGSAVLTAPPGGPIDVDLGTHHNFQTTVGLLVHF